MILTVLQKFFSRADELTKRFLPQTLFAFQAKIIQAQMRADVNNGAVLPESRAWLQSACDDLRPCLTVLSMPWISVSIKVNRPRKAAGIPKHVKI